MEAAPEPRRAPAWLIVLAVLPVALGTALVAWLYWPASGETTSQHTAGNAARLPDLGARSKDLPNAPANAPANEAANEEAPPDVTPEPEPENSEREIDILLGRLAHATKVGDGKGRRLVHEELAGCRPSERVDARVQFHIENEQNAWVRVEYFRAYHAEDGRRTWALRVLDTRTSQFTGTTDQYLSGEPEEILLYVDHMLPMLFEGLHRDERLMAFLRDLLASERPEWVLNHVSKRLLEWQNALFRHSPLEALKDELRNLLVRATATSEIRERAFVLWLCAQADRGAVLSELEQPSLREYLVVLIKLLPPVADGEVMVFLGLSDKSEVRGWVKENAEALSELVVRMLSGQMDPILGGQMVAALSKHQLPKAREIVDAGLARKDELLPHWLTALGRMAAGDDDLQRLARAADDGDANVAQGAVEGLRICPLPGADQQLRHVLEQGANIAVKSQALGAMLHRSDNKAALLDEYLDFNKDASLRAVAVAHVPKTDVDRLKKTVEDDPALRVRQAALTRLGELKDKRLRHWFILRADRDPSPVLRQQAKRYADELKEE